MSDDVSGVALVTGGGRGIGEGSRASWRRGCRSLWARTRKEVDEVAAGVDGLALVGDVSEPPTAREWIDRVDAARARRSARQQRRDRTHEDRCGSRTWTKWWRVFEVNVRGPMSCCHAVLPGMVERGQGRIVNVGSGGSYLPLTGTIARGTACGASKAALGRFSEPLASQVETGASRSS